MLATGTVAGALDESFSDESQLEIWAPDFLDKNEYDLGGIEQNAPKGSVKDNSRFLFNSIHFMSTLVQVQSSGLGLSRCHCGWHGKR